MGQRPGAGRAVHQDGSADAARRHRSGESLQRDAHAAGAVEAGRGRAALAGRNTVDALQGRAGTGLRQVQGLLCYPGDRARREPEEEGRTLRPRRVDGRFHRLGEDRRRHEDAAGRVEGHWPGHAWQREGRVGAFPRRLRQVLHPSSRRLEAAQAGLDREPQAQGSTGHRGRAAVAVHRVGAGRVAHQAPAGGLEGDWPGQEEQVRRDLEPVPRRVRSVLRAVQESRFDCADRQDGGSRSGGRRARGVSARG